MHLPTLLLSVLLPLALAQSMNCGPKHANRKCAASTDCCSEYGWCGTTAAHCASTCLKPFSGANSACVKKVTSVKPTATATAGAFASEIPVIDVCGAKSNHVSCPGAGPGNFFYRCCSKNGHCGPKNNIQAQGDYCGDGCQAGYGKCNTMPVPKLPTTKAKIVGAGDHCGPIVNAKCGGGLCCSGANFCGSEEDFCGAANFCQSKWGHCD
ncbi:hypothetical protein EDC01DRAFT_716105 [Geopyxis carbonaria]|nr:hypothetical protein EDC01DRAFT_716105 [Geopyxis carbonaria]